MAAFITVFSHSVALINHSCLPSVIVTFNGTSADVRAVRDMKPGDEVSQDEVARSQFKFALLCGDKDKVNLYMGFTAKTHGRLLVLEDGLKILQNRHKYAAGARSR